MKSFRTALLLTVFCVGLSISTQFALAEEKLSTISITGEGMAEVAPDMAVINISVVRQAKTAREGLDANTKAMSDVFSSLKESGIEERDLQTSNFNIRPQYTHYRPKQGEEQKPPKLTSYTVSNSLTIRIRKLESVGQILDQLVTLGVNSGGNINFTNSNPAEALKTARKEAVEDAMEKATLMVETAGAELGKIISMSEYGTRPQPRPIAAAARNFELKQATPVPVAAGENQYKIQVQVVWEIDQ